MLSIPISIVFEDELSRAVIKRLLLKYGRRFVVAREYHSNGFGQIKKNISYFNRSAKKRYYFVLTDLDVRECPPSLINDWIKDQLEDKLIFRIAEREVESWLLADILNLAEYMGVKGKKWIPSSLQGNFTSDAILDPKDELLKLALHSKLKTIVEDVVRVGSRKLEQGPDYNGLLVRFVYHKWSPEVAHTHSISLQKAIEAIRTIK